MGHGARCGAVSLGLGAVPGCARCSAGELGAGGRGKLFSARVSSVFLCCEVSLLQVVTVIYSLLLAL